MGCILSDDETDEEIELRVLKKKIEDLSLFHHEQMLKRGNQIILLQTQVQGLRRMLYPTPTTHCTRDV